MRNFNLIFVLFFSLNSGFAQSVAISVAPVLDVGSLASTQAVSLRNSVLAELTESYDCVVLSRSRGLALVEEQRALVLDSLRPELLPYPTSADFLIVPEISRDLEGIVLKLSYTRISGNGDAEISRKLLRFESIEQLQTDGPDQLIQALVDAFSLQLKQHTPATKAMFADKAWAVLPWLDYSSAMPEHGGRSEILMERAGQILEQELPRIEKLAAETVSASGIDMYAGATETQAAAIGKDVGADYLLSGSISQTGDGLLLYAFVVRSQDAVVLAAREMPLEPEYELEENFDLLVKSLIAGLPQFSYLSGSSEAANLEEARLLYEIAETFRESNGGKQKSLYNALDTYLAARIVAQDTYYEQEVLERLTTLIEEHPNYYHYRENWRSIKQKAKDLEWNKYMIDVIKTTLAQPYGDDELSILADAYSCNGDWETALQYQNELIKREAWDPKRSRFDAPERLRVLSLSGRLEEAASFFEMLPKRFRWSSSYEQAAHNFRRMGDEKRELATIIEMFEECDLGASYDPARFCMLSNKYLKSSEQLRLGERLDELYFGRDPLVQWHLIQAALQVGDQKAASRRAALLLARKKIGRADFKNKDDFRSRLKEIVGDLAEKWPTAASIQPIPERYRMYIQPVGQYDEKLLQNAVVIASAFFGCEIIIRPGVEPPEGRSAFHGNDMLTYYGVPVLRHLNIARPIPKGGIMQLYYIDSMFSSEDGAFSGSSYSIYRRGLGIMFSPEIFSRLGFDEKKTTKGIASEIIRHFRYYFERSQEIWYSDSPDNESCVNSPSSSRKDYDLGYCPECVMNYANADMEAIHRFAQSIPMPVAYGDKYGLWTLYDHAEAKDLEAYIERVGKQ